MATIKLKDLDNKIWFTSDLHYSQKRGIEIRPQFKTVDEMNKTIVENINNTVDENDTLFHLGDWSFDGIDNILKLRNAIKCKNIHIVLGNHDHHIARNIENRFTTAFKSINDYVELIGKKKVEFVLMHFRIHSWNCNDIGSIHLHGHHHSKGADIFTNVKCMDVGIDGSANFKPYSIDEIKDLMRDKEIVLRHNN